MKHSKITIEKITERKYQAKFEITNEMGIKAFITISGESLEETVNKTERFLGKQNINYERGI